MKRGFAGEAHGAGTRGVRARGLGVLHVERRNVEGGDAGAGGGEHDSRAGVQQRLRRDLDAQLGGEVGSAEDEGGEAGSGRGDGFGLGKPLEALDKRDEAGGAARLGQHGVRHGQFAGAFNLGKKDMAMPGAGFRDGLKILQAGEASKPVDAHHALGPGGVARRQPAHRVLARRVFQIGRDGILQIDADHVGPRRLGLGETVGPGAGHEEHGTSGRGHQWYSSPPETFIASAVM